MNIAARMFLLVIAGGFPIFGYTIEKPIPLSNEDLKAVVVKDDTENIMSVDFHNKIQWKILTTKAAGENQEEMNCTYEYKSTSRNIQLENMPCHIGQMTVAVYAYELNDSAVIFDFPSERGGVFWLISATTNDELKIINLPYMSGEEDGISFTVDEQSNITAVTREDKFIISPDKSKEFYLRKYEGSGVGFKLYSY
ncbi:MAG: hypothetical protein RR184_06680 [Citrobacter sp.]|uniref:hypothetical protein n=1 Tax=Citrobacter sp. TaxID=1896336 RepID=UPI002FCB2302